MAATKYRSLSLVTVSLFCAPWLEAEDIIQSLYPLPLLLLSPVTPCPPLLLVSGRQMGGLIISNSYYCSRPLLWFDKHYTRTRTHTRTAPAATRGLLRDFYAGLMRFFDSTPRITRA